MTKPKYAALFVRADSAYKKREVFAAYDAERDATKYDDDLPVVAHPPCRAWGVMAHMSFRNADWTVDDESLRKRAAEKKLAMIAVDKVRECGGIIEHPSGSQLFQIVLPDTGSSDWGGFTIKIDQFDFGHVAHKMTKLYISGIKRKELPGLPPKCMNETDRSIAGNVAGTKRCTQYQREYSPEALIDWFEEVLSIIAINKQVGE